MTDPALVEKKLALIESCVSDLRRLASPDTLANDIRESSLTQLQQSGSLTASHFVNAAFTAIGRRFRDGRVRSGLSPSAPRPS